MDNRSINVCSVGQEDLTLALKIAWKNVPGRTISHYKVINLTQKTSYYGEPTTRHIEEYVEDDKGIHTLILYWSNPNKKDVKELPYPLNLDQTITFVEGWLNQVTYPKCEEDGGDISTEKGWKLFTDDWGHVQGDWATFVGIQPKYALYGK